MSVVRDQCTFFCLMRICGLACGRVIMCSQVKKEEKKGMLSNMRQLFSGLSKNSSAKEMPEKTSRPTSNRTNPGPSATPVSPTFRRAPSNASTVASGFRGGRISGGNAVLDDDECAAVDVRSPVRSHVRSTGDAASSRTGRSPGEGLGGLSSPMSSSYHRPRTGENEGEAGVYMYCVQNAFETSQDS